MEGKQQHRQHFNLSEPAKQMLEELTAQRYPGRQRRQSQVIEDLITEAFTKERDMSTVATEMLDPEPGGFAPSTREAIQLAGQEAARMGADEIYPEHLLLGVIAQGENKAAKLLCMYGMDMQAIRIQASEVFKGHYTGLERGGSISRESEECLDRAIAFARRLQSPLVFPEHVVVMVLRHESMQPFLDPFLSSLETLLRRLEGTSGIGTSSPNRVDWTADADNPWSTVAQRYAPGQVVTGVITRRAPFGVFVRVEDGVEGLVHLSELPPGITAPMMLHEGAQYPVRVLRIDAERHRLGLSLRDVTMTPPIAALLCQSCKREVRAGWKHCVYCGASLVRVCPNCGTP